MHTSLLQLNLDELYPMYVCRCVLSLQLRENSLELIVLQMACNATIIKISNQIMMDSTVLKGKRF